MTNLYIVIRQYGKSLRVLSTRTTGTILTDKMIARVQRGIESLPLEVGYYDVVLTSRPNDPRYDVDSVIEVR